MEFSNRDGKLAASLLASQSGQAVTEYILILVVVVAMVLGGVYQLNDAFKVWANNYFGSYLACLLETGDLPSIGGTPGDSGLCNQLFKEFSLADGRPRLNTTDTGAPAPASGAAGGARETTPPGTIGHAAGGGGGSAGGGAFGRGSGSLARGSGGGRFNGKNTAINTGDTSTNNYGNGYSATNKGLDTHTKTRLDNGFAFENEAEDKQRRRGLASASNRPAEGSSTSKIRIHPKDLKKDVKAAEDSQLTFGNFLRMLIIAALIVALVVFIGGQMLQIGKSME